MVVILGCLTGLNIQVILIEHNILGKYLALNMMVLNMVDLDQVLNMMDLLILELFQLNIQGSLLVLSLGNILLHLQEM